MHFLCAASVAHFFYLGGAMKIQKIIILSTVLILLTALTVVGIHAAELTEAGKELLKYDLDGDGRISISDVTTLLNYLSSSCGHVRVPFPEKEPTCEEDGSTGGSYCTNCEAVLEKPETIPAIGHNFVDNVCTNCGKRNASEGLRFVLNDTKDSYTVTGIGTCQDTDIIIPSTH